MNKAEIRRQLVEHYLDYYSLALSMLGSDDDAREAVQEALARTLAVPLLRNADHYCRRTLKHVAVDMVRQRKRVQPIEGMEIEAREEGMDEGLLEAVRRLRDGLPSAQRALVCLRMEQNLGYDDLARLTGMSRSTVRRRLAEAYRTMKKGLEDYI